MTEQGKDQNHKSRVKSSADEWGGRRVVDGEGWLLQLLTLLGTYGRVGKARSSCRTAGGVAIHDRALLTVVRGAIAYGARLMVLLPRVGESKPTLWDIRQATRCPQARGTPGNGRELQEQRWKKQGSKARRSREE